MIYYLIALSVDGKRKYYFNQRTLVQHYELAHPFPNKELAELSFRKSRFKDLEYRLVPYERQY